jgi:hypothetical protein
MWLIKHDLSSWIGLGTGKKGKLKIRACLAMLLKTNAGKMSAWGYARMSMKINGLSHYSHNVYENKRVYSNRRSKEQRLVCANDRSGFAPSRASRIRWRG